MQLMRCSRIISFSFTLFLKAGWPEGKDPDAAPVIAADCSDLVSSKKVLYSKAQSLCPCCKDELPPFQELESREDFILKNCLCECPTDKTIYHLNCLRKESEICYGMLYERGFHCVRCDRNLSPLYEDYCLEFINYLLDNLGKGFLLKPLEMFLVDDDAEKILVRVLRKSKVNNKSNFEQLLNLLNSKTDEKSQQIKKIFCKALSEFDFKEEKQQVVSQDDFESFCLEI